MSDGSRHQLAIVTETIAGTTPANPAWKRLRHVSCSMSLKKDPVNTAELRADRQMSLPRHGNKSGQGDIGAELSYGTYDDLLEGLLCGTWTTNVLKAGVGRKTFTLERYFTDLVSGDNPYHRFTGCEVSGASIEVAPNAMVGVTFNMFARDMSVAGTAITGSTYTAETTSEQMDSFAGSITEGGSAIAVVTKLSLKIENGVKPRFVIGSAASIQPERGSFQVTGTLTAFFENSTLLQKYLAQTVSALVLVVGDGTNTYTINLPKIKFMGGEVPTSGPGSLSLTMPFTAGYDSTQATTLVITRS